LSHAWRAVARRRVSLHPSTGRGALEPLIRAAILGAALLTTQTAAAQDTALLVALDQSISVQNPDLTNPDTFEQRILKNTGLPSVAVMSFADCTRLSYFYPASSWDAPPVKSPSAGPCAGGSFNRQRTDFRILLDRLNAFLRIEIDKRRIILWLVTDGQHDPQGTCGPYDTACDRNFPAVSSVLDGIAPADQRRIEIALVYVGTEKRRAFVQQTWSKLDSPSGVRFTFEPDTSLDHIARDLADRMIAGRGPKLAVLESNCTWLANGAKTVIYSTLRVTSDHDAEVRMNTAALASGSNPLSLYPPPPPPMPISRVHTQSIGRNSPNPINVQAEWAIDGTPRQLPVEFDVTVEAPSDLHWTQRIRTKSHCVVAAGTPDVTITTARVTRWWPFGDDLSVSMNLDARYSGVPGLKLKFTDPRTDVKCQSLLHWFFTEVEPAPLPLEPMDVMEGVVTLPLAMTPKPGTGFCAIQPLGVSVVGEPIVAPTEAHLKYGSQDVEGRLLLIGFSISQTFFGIMLFLLPLTPILWMAVQTVRDKYARKAPRDGIAVLTSGPDPLNMWDGTIEVIDGVPQLKWGNQSVVNGKSIAPGARARVFCCYLFVVIACVMFLEGNLLLALFRLRTVDLFMSPVLIGIVGVIGVDVTALLLYVRLLKKRGRDEHVKVAVDYWLGFAAFFHVIATVTDLNGFQLNVVTAFFALAWALMFWSGRKPLLGAIHSLSMHGS